MTYAYCRFPEWEIIQFSIELKTVGRYSGFRDMNILRSYGLHIFYLINNPNYHYFYDMHLLIYFSIPGVVHDGVKAVSNSQDSAVFKLRADC